MRVNIFFNFMLETCACKVMQLHIFFLFFSILSSKLCQLCIAHFDAKIEFVLPLHRPCIIVFDETMKQMWFKKHNRKVWQAPKKYSKKGFEDCNNAQSPYIVVNIYNWCIGENISPTIKIITCISKTIKLISFLLQRSY